MPEVIQLHSNTNPREVIFRGKEVQGGAYAHWRPNASVLVVTLRAGLREKLGDYYVNRIEENHAQYCRTHGYDYIVFDVTYFF